MSDTISWTRRKALGAAIAGTLVAALPRVAHAATTIRWATVLPATHPAAVMMEKVAKQVREDTGGSLEIQTFPAGQLGSSRDLIEAVSSGAIQIVDEGAAQFGQFVPQFSILEAPYIWRDAQHMRRVMNSPILDEMNALLVAKRQMRIIGATYYGKRHVTSGSKAIRTVDDMKGFKLRIPEVDTFRAMAEAWGAKPTPLNFAELYLALSQGAVDGQENPLPTIQSGKFFEVQKFLILTGHIITPRLIAIHESTWQALSSKEKESLKGAMNKYGIEQDNEILAQEGKLVDTFKASGMTVIQPDVASFSKPVLAALPAKFESKWGKGLWERIAAY
ncbi:MAG TPA: sialic acid TRAP transporter substrate-binding protein SiaP [Casimicrobiaceae bacterium]|nr:sialic acid TRAP transporter substrate-binding protein SiaP [Casimicrobiaceae bacterium]